MGYEFSGHCPECGRKIGLSLEPTGGAVEAMLLDANRLLKMFDVEARCTHCEKVVEPNGLRAKP